MTKASNASRSPPLEPAAISLVLKADYNFTSSFASGHRFHPSKWIWDQATAVVSRTGLDSEAQVAPDRGQHRGIATRTSQRKEGIIMPTEISTEIQIWPIDKLILYARNPRKNDAAVDRMCASIVEFGFKIPCLVRSGGEVIDGHLRLKAARKLAITDIPVILCDEWTPTQVKAFRLMVNQSATWADWDDELLRTELADLQTLDYDLALTGFDTKELDDLLLNDTPEEDAVPLPPVNPVSCSGDLWLCGSHRVLCGDATDPEAVSRLLGDRKPRLMVCDPPYGISLDSEWRDRAGLNTRGRAEPSYLKKRTKGHTDHDFRRHASRLVRGIRAGPKPRCSVCLARVGLHQGGSQWP